MADNSLPSSSKVAESPAISGSGSSTSSSDGSTSSYANKRCNDLLEGSLKNHQLIKKLVLSIEELGCKLPKDFFSCRPCNDDKISGGFKIDSDATQQVRPCVVLCEDNLKDLHRNYFENTLAHELIHAYDYCRAKIDEGNCTQLACTEIRASGLSGECSFIFESLYGNVTIFGQHRDCVKRRATKSVAMNPACQAIAAKAVEEAFAKCYDDRKPINKWE